MIVSGFAIGRTRYTKAPIGRALSLHSHRFFLTPNTKSTMATQKYPMETYHGIVRTPADAIKLFEACRLGLLPRVQRRLSEKERQAIRSGSVFVWDEREAGMRRWTDGKSWSASRVSGSFLTYREMEGKRGGGFSTIRRFSDKTPDSSGRGSDEDQDEGEPDGYRYKADGLMKQSFSITTSSGQHLHLISYYARPAPGEPDLPQPTADPSLRSIVPAKGMYPESSLTDNTPIAPITRVPIAPQPHPPHRSHYTHRPPPPPLATGPGGPHHQAYPPGYGQQGYSWPPSPIATPPYNHHYVTSSSPYPVQQHPQQAQGQHSRTPPPPPGYYSGAAPHAPPASTLPPFGNAALPLSANYDRMTLPPPQPTGPSRTTPPMPHAPHREPHPTSNSPRSAYRQPPHLLPPLPTAPSSSSSSSYQTSPTSRNGGSLLPALNAPSATGAANTSSAAGSSALTPPYQQQRPYFGDSYSSGNSPSSTNGGSGGAGGSKASLSALLHPTPVSSKPNSVNAGSTNSAGSSPRHISGPPLMASGLAGSAGGPPSLVPQQFLRPAPSGEDSRALSRLDKKFCI